MDIDGIRRGVMDRKAGRAIAVAMRTRIATTMQMRVDLNRCELRNISGVPADETEAPGKATVGGPELFSSLDGDEQDEPSKLPPWPRDLNDDRNPVAPRSRFSEDIFVRRQVM